MFEDLVEEPCIWCNEPININGLIGHETNQCPCCGKPVFDQLFKKVSVGTVFMLKEEDSSRWVKFSARRAVCAEDADVSAIGGIGAFKASAVIYPY